MLNLVVIVLLILGTVGDLVLLQRGRRVRVYSLSLTVVDSDSFPVSSARVFLDGVYRSETDARGD